MSDSSTYSLSGLGAACVYTLSMAVTILDGPLGTELLRRGIPTPLPGWSAQALVEAPSVVAEIHRDYASAGATVHTTNTFRTRRRTFPADWERLARLAVSLCRESIPKEHRVAGSLAPLEDCYRPDLSPQDSRAEHRELAQVLADTGCDLLLCETFPNASEGLVAVEEAVATGTETWASFTAGPEANLLTPSELRSAAEAALKRGATAVLVNCVPVSSIEVYVSELRDLGAPFGAYANAGEADEGFGWRSAPQEPTRYADAVAKWIELGATLIGGCCGTGPHHVRELAARFGV